VRWRHGGQRFTESTSDSTAFVRGLFMQYGEAISELEVHRASLEQTYLTLVHEAEAAR
jgi:ABC-2 type transport system ATP-binding protein